MKYYIYQNNEKVKEVDGEKTVTITGLKANNKYSFAVSAFNGVRESEKSNVVEVTTGSVPVTSITLTISGGDKMEIGQSIKATVAIEPENATNKSVTYKSSDEKVATVAADGTVKAVAVGTATITATAGEKSATAKVTVYEALVSVTDLKSSDVTTSSVTLSWT